MRIALTLAFLLAACGGEAPAPTPTAAPTPAAPPAAAPAAPVGPDGPTSIVIPTITSISTDPADIAGGLEVFTAKGCGACHKFGEKLVGPDLKGVFTRRSIPWVERMITDPGVMVKQDPQAKKLFGELMVEMPKQGVAEQELPSLLAYLKSQGG